MKIWVQVEVHRSTRARGSVPTREISHMSDIVNTQRTVRSTISPRAVDMKRGLWGFTGSKWSSPILTRGPQQYAFIEKQCPCPLY